MSMITIQGAREHYLKNISLSIPKDKLVVFTGLSGSGKSSLAFDTLYAEGQRRYVESLSAYARQFLEMMPKPDVDSIDGLSPAISIEQKTTSRNPRSTVGTVTEIYDYLRILFARVGKAYSPATGKPIEAQTRTQIVDQIMRLPQGSRLYILAPVVRGAKGEYRKEIMEFQKRGYQRIKIDGVFYEMDSVPPLDRYKQHHLSLVIDRIVLTEGEDSVQRLTESVEAALYLGNGLVMVESSEQEFPPLLLSSKLSCPESGFTLDEIEPRLFSFNNPAGACPSCGGLGTNAAENPFWGDKEEDDIEDADLPVVHPCPKCHGYRLRKEALCVRVGDLHIGQVTALSIDEALAWCNGITAVLSPAQLKIAERVLKEIKARLHFLSEVGLHYLTLGRASGTLSGGESQRIRLASQIGSGLTGVMYVLDEPSIGLHPRDNDRLLKTLCTLRDLGNSVLVVEHDEETIRHADHIIDMGKGAGQYGGDVVAQGTLQEVLASKDSLTAAYLRHERFIPVPSIRRPGRGDFLKVIGATMNNLRGVDVAFPLGTLTCVTGVSGGGKSSLVIETLYRGLRLLMRRQSLVGLCEGIEGYEHIDKIVDIDQSPIGRTPRSNPATYTGVFTPIREWFSWLPEARARGYQPGRFSFNVKGGRCEACQGDGVITVQMHFLPDVYVECEVCKGRRYSRETLEIKYKGKSIADVLAMPIEDAAPFFEAIPSIHARLQTLCDVGLGYLQVGQRATTLSGGEAQRIKLAKELTRRPTGKTLYILDEPTTGLHFDDVRQLLIILQRLVDQGNTVIVIEHNLEVIKTADWVIDVGPEGGSGGGQIVACGTPEDIVTVPGSYTGKYLAPLLTPKKVKKG